MDSNAPPKENDVRAENEALKLEIERLHRELAQTSHEKIQSAQYGLVLLDEKQALQQRCDELEAIYDTTRHELDILKEALAKVQTSQKVSTTTGIEQEESLLQETATKEASLTSSLQELEKELKQVRQELSRVQVEKERLQSENFEISKQGDVSDWERKNLRSELKDMKLREQRLLTDNNELEEENISLQKQVSSLRSSQVEFEGAKHEVRRLKEEVESLNAQLEELGSLRRIGEQQLEEALEALQSEREQKYALRRELDQRLTAESPVFHLDGLAFAGFRLGSKRLRPVLSHPVTSSARSSKVSASVGARARLGRGGISGGVDCDSGFWDEGSCEMAARTGTLEPRGLDNENVYGRASGCSAEGARLSCCCGGLCRIAGDSPRLSRIRDLAGAVTNQPGVKSDTSEHDICPPCSSDSHDSCTLLRSSGCMVAHQASSDETNMHICMGSVAKEHSCGRVVGELEAPSTFSLRGDGSKRNNLFVTDVFRSSHSRCSSISFAFSETDVPEFAFHDSASVEGSVLGAYLTHMEFPLQSSKCKEHSWHCKCRKLASRLSGLIVDAVFAP